MNFENGDLKLYTAIPLPKSTKKSHYVLTVKPQHNIKAIHSVLKHTVAI